MNTPSNLLMTLQAEVVIERLDRLTLRTQKTMIPGISMRSTKQPNPLVDIPEPGDTLYFDELAVEFLVDSDLTNWLSVYKWLKGLGFPDDSQQYANLYNRGLTKPDGGIRSDITQIILDGEQNPFLNIEFKDCFPISLSGINLDVTQTESSNYATAKVLFAYTDYDITKA